MKHQVSDEIVDAVVLVHDFLEVVKGIRTAFDSFLPLGSFEVSAYFHYFLEKVAAEPFADEFDDRDGDEGQLHVHIHRYLNFAPVKGDGSVLNHDVPIVYLYIFGIQFGDKAKFLTQLWLVGNGLAVGEDGVVMVQPTVADSFVVGLSA
jgi:hypothetical protein